MYYVNIIQNKNHFTFFTAKISRDSGFGSGDPSPVQGYSPSLHNGEHHKEFFRSNSSPAPKGQTKKSKTSKRPSKWL